MLHYTLFHHSNFARLTSDTRLYRETGRTEKRWHITNQNNGTGYSKDRHNDVAVTTSMIGQQVSDVSDEILHLSAQRRWLILYHLINPYLDLSGQMHQDLILVFDPIQIDLRDDEKSESIIISSYNQIGACNQAVWTCNIVLESKTSKCEGLKS